ncbi:MAG: polymerase sigma factor RpoE [Labilithrix sp.]|nr:polymerase sigma factor RpoE [Labilithrix sp.]
MSAHQGVAGALAAPATLGSARLGRAGVPEAHRRARIEQLVREHHVFVWRSVRRFGVREADIDDVVQEVFLVAAKNIDAIEPGRERGYLFRTSINVAAHARRSFQRRREVVDEERLIAEIDLRPSPEQSAATSEERVRLQAILDTMSVDLRAVFVLFELESMTMADIAEMLRVPPGTVASRLRRARELFMTHVGVLQRECEER